MKDSPLNRINLASWKIHNVLFRSLLSSFSCWLVQMLSQINTDLWAGIWEPLTELDPFSLSFLGYSLRIHSPPFPHLLFPGSWSLWTCCWGSLALWFLIGFSPRTSRQKYSRGEERRVRLFHWSTHRHCLDTGWQQLYLPKTSVYWMALPASSLSRSCDNTPTLPLPLLFRSRQDKVSWHLGEGSGGGGAVSPSLVDTLTRTLSIPLIKVP